jgi:hypothetical protein
MHARLRQILDSDVPAERKVAQIRRILDQLERGQGPGRPGPEAPQRRTFDFFAPRNDGQARPGPRLRLEREERDGREERGPRGLEDLRGIFERMGGRDGRGLEDNLRQMFDRFGGRDGRGFEDLRGMFERFSQSEEGRRFTQEQLPKILERLRGLRGGEREDNREERGAEGRGRGGERREARPQRNDNRNTPRQGQNRNERRNNRPNRGGDDFIF